MGRKRLASSSEESGRPIKIKTKKHKHRSDEHNENTDKVHEKDEKIVKLDSCSYGIIIKDQDKCHGTSFTKEKCLHLVGDLTKQNRDIFLMRTDIKIIKRDETICDHHLQKVLKIYPMNQIVCCDPYKNHRTKIRRNLKEVSLKDVSLFREKGVLNVKPGQKLCTNCFAKLKYKKNEQDVSDSESSHSNSSDSDAEEDETKQ